MTFDLKSLHIYKRDAILTATINRPEALNAIDFEIMDQLDQVISEMENSRTLRVFILRGEGDQHFASGGDLRKFSGLVSRKDGLKMVRRMENLLQRIENLPCWTIASVNGDAYGGGCEILLAFDFRIASEKARFGFTQSRFHLPPGWGGLTRLVERVGRAAALEWLGGSLVIDAAEALDKGLVNRISPAKELEKRTLDWAGDLSVVDRLLIKSLKDGARTASSQDRYDSIRSEQDKFADFWAGEEHHRRVSEFLGRAGNKK